MGTVLDILVVGLLLTVVAVVRDRRDRISRYIEEIDDLKKWDSEQARLHIAGAIRRLAKLGRTNIDLSGLILRNFSFVSHDIESLKGATFSLGLRLDRMSKNATELENVGFSNVDCSQVIFSKITFDKPLLGLVGKNLHFAGTKLIGACFDGARLTWTDVKENQNDWYEDAGVDDYGNPVSGQVHYGTFALADLHGCSFCHAALDRADFRDAMNIRSANFKGALGLETCLFDDDVREDVLASAQARS